MNRNISHVFFSLLGFVLSAFWALKNTDIMIIMSNLAPYGAFMCAVLAMAALTARTPPQSLPKAPTATELDLLLAVIPNAQYRAMVLVMAHTGVRISELCTLLIEHVCWSTDTPYLKIKGKGGRERIVVMNQVVQDALRAWLEIRGSAPGPLFQTRAGNPFSRKTVWAMLKRYCQRAGIRHIHPHMLRHYFGTTLADQGVPVERVAELMGHSNIQTSKIYILVSPEQKKAAVERIDRRPRILRWWSRMQNKHFRFFALPTHRHIAGRPRTVGREKELHQLQVNVDKGVDSLIIGPVGVGKTHLLELIQGKNIIRLKSLSPAKEAIIALAEELYHKGILKTENANQDKR